MKFNLLKCVHHLSVDDNLEGGLKKKILYNEKQLKSKWANCVVVVVKRWERIHVIFYLPMETICLAAIKAATVCSTKTKCQQHTWNLSHNRQLKRYQQLQPFWMDGQIRRYHRNGMLWAMVCFLYLAFCVWFYSLLLLLLLLKLLLCFFLAPSSVMSFQDSIFVSEIFKYDDRLGELTHNIIISWHFSSSWRDRIVDNIVGKVEIISK